MRRNRNITLSQLQAALIAAGGSRIIAANDLDVTHSWIYSLIAKFEREGVTFPEAVRRNASPRRSAIYKPTRKEIRAACREIQASWTKREFAMRSVSKTEQFTVPWVVLEGEPREAIW